jgi:hypothetical protein
MDPNLKKYEECARPALEWLNKNAPDFVIENVREGFDLSERTLDLQNKYIKHMEEIKELQYLIIESLEQQIKELEDEKNNRYK